MNPIAIRLLSQQLVSPQWSTPAEVVSHMGALQAQDYRMVRWAVAMRMCKPSYESLKLAYDKGEIIRLHLLRGTWQMVSAQDYWWMLSLYCDKATKVVKGWMRANSVSIDDDELREVRNVMVDYCDKHGSATKEDFFDALVRRGRVMDKHRLGYHIRLAELGGILCSGNLSPMHATFDLTERKVAHRDNMERDEMLMLLALKYFRSHSPAMFEDFVWWAGLSVSDCRKAISLLGSELHKMSFGNQEFLIHESCRTRGFRRGVAHLLAPFDEYLVGYKSRHLALAPENASHAYTNNGIFFPVVALDGMVCGNWSPFSTQPDIRLFSHFPDSSLFDKQWATYCRITRGLKFE